MDSIFCSKCGQTNPVERTTCQKCFGLLRRPLGSAPAACSRCHAQSPTGATYCVGCGTAFAAMAAPPLRAPIGSAMPSVAQAKPPADGDRPMDLALASRIVVGMGGLWTALGAIIWLAEYITPIILYRCEVNVSTSTFYGIWIAAHIVEQIWVLVDIIDRGSPRWWLAVSFILPVGIWLYVQIERSDS